MRWRRRTPETGAVLVEAALVALLLIVLASGILEYASLFSSTSDTSSAVRSAARAGSLTTAQGNVSSDYDIIEALVSRSGSPRTDISRLVIYKAGGGASQPPASCVSGSLNVPPGLECDVYDASNLTMTSAQIEGLPASQRRWPESSRQPGTDYIGVWVHIIRPRVFAGIVPAPSDYNDNFVMPIPPKPSVATGGGWSPSALSSVNPATVWTGTQPWPKVWWCDGGPNGTTDCLDASNDGSSGPGGSGGGGSS